MPSVAALLIAASAACGGGMPAERGERPRDAPSAEPDARAVPARKAAGKPTEERRRACEARCQRVVETRHDACGRGAGRPWPVWCGEDDARWQTACELDCLASPP